MTLRRGSLAWLLASILFLTVAFLVFPGFWPEEASRLALGAYHAAAGRSATTGRGAAAGGMSATARAAAAVAIMISVVVTVVVVVAILVVILFLVAVVAPAKPGPRMTFVLAGKGRG